MSPLSCSTANCQNVAIALYCWPGRAEAAVCNACIPKLVAIAGALEMHLPIRLIVSSVRYEDPEPLCACGHARSAHAPDCTAPAENAGGQCDCEAFVGAGPQNVEPVSEKERLRVLAFMGSTDPATGLAELNDKGRELVDAVALKMRDRKGAL